VKNQSPYFLNFYNIELNAGKASSLYSEPFMVAPFSTDSFEPKINFIPTQAKYNLINDFGANQSYTATIENLK